MAEEPLDRGEDQLSLSPDVIFHFDAQAVPFQQGLKMVEATANVERPSLLAQCGYRLVSDVLGDAKKVNSFRHFHHLRQSIASVAARNA